MGREDSWLHTAIEGQGGGRLKGSHVLGREEGAGERP